MSGMAVYPQHHIWRYSKRRRKGKERGGLFTSVALKLLHYFLCLKIPQIDAVILRSRHNPLPVCNRECRKYAILVILMAGVRLQTFSSAIVPKAQGIVQRSHENEFAIGREFDKGPEMIKGLVQIIIQQSDQSYTGGLSSSINVFKHWPVAVSQIRLLVVPLVRSYSCLRVS